MVSQLLLRWMESNWELNDTHRKILLEHTVNDIIENNLGAFCDDFKNSLKRRDHAYGGGHVIEKWVEPERNENGKQLNTQKPIS